MATNIPYFKINVTTLTPNLRKQLARRMQEVIDGRHTWNPQYFAEKGWWLMSYENPIGHRVCWQSSEDYEDWYVDVARRIDKEIPLEEALRIFKVPF